MGAVRLVLLPILLYGCVRAGFEQAGGQGDGPPVGFVRPAVDRPAGPGQATFGGASDPGWKGVTLSAALAGSVGVRLGELQGFGVKSGKLSSGRAWGAAATMGNSIFVFGGGNSLIAIEATDEVASYQPATDQLAVVGHLPRGIVGLQAVLHKDGSIYLLMGIDATIDKTYEAQALRFDQKTVTTAASGLYGAYHHAAVKGSDGLIYSFGGYGSGPLKDTIEAFDPAQGKPVAVSATLSLGARDKLAACAAPDGSIYLFGGALFHGNLPQEGSQLTDQILRFQTTPASVTLVTTAKLPQPMMNVAAALLPDGNVYLVGGDVATGGGVTTAPTSQVLRFDPLTRTLSVLPDLLPAPLSGAIASVGDNGKLYLFGGRTSTGLAVDILELHPFAKSGSALSPLVDTGGSGTKWLTLDWSATAPAGTSVVLNVRASDAPFDPQAAVPSWQPVAAPPVSTGLPAGRYLQWRADLATSNTALTPSLASVSLSYAR